MSWLQISLAALSLINLVFILGAAYLLNEILRTSESAKTELVKAAQLSSEGAQSLLVAARRTVVEMERIQQAHLAQERSGASAIHELSRQVKTLSDLVQSGLHRAEVASRDKQGHDERVVEDARAKLRVELNAALAANHRLEEELNQIRHQLPSLTQSHSGMESEELDAANARMEQMQSLLTRQTELEAALIQAMDRANAAEQRAEESARKLVEQFDAKRLDGNATSGMDQSSLIQELKDQAEALVGREKQLLDKIAHIEDALKRNLTEKAFIEDHFVRLTRDSADGSV